jgi:hypothetical protein
MQGEEYWKEKIECYQGSGLTQREFCLRYGYRIDAFKYWLKKSRVKKNTPVNKGDFFVKLESAQSISILEIEYPNGVKLRLDSLSSLSDLRSLILLYHV